MFPIHLDIGFHQFYYYEGLYFGIAIAVAYLWARKRIQKNELSMNLFHNALIGILIGSVIGARLFHFLFWQPSLLLSDPLVFFRFWEGGLTITGGLAGGIIGGGLVLIKQKAGFLRYFAVLSPTILLGQAVGRIGCFLNGDAWGIPTSLPWGMNFPKFGTFVPRFQADHSLPSLAWNWAHTQNLVTNSDLTTPPLHPTQLYESLGDIIILFVVLLLFKKYGKDRGGRIILVVHAGAYSLLRYLVEFLHGDRDVTVWAGMTSIQMVLAGITTICLVFAFVEVRRLK